MTCGKCERLIREGLLDNVSDVTNVQVLPVKSLSNATTKYYSKIASVHHVISIHQNIIVSVLFFTEVALDGADVCFIFVNPLEDIFFGTVVGQIYEDLGQTFCDNSKSFRN